MGHKEKKKHKKNTRRRSRDRSKERPSKQKPSRSPPQTLTADDVYLLKEEKNRQKQMMKALETPEEKRARRLAKKEVKERKRKQQMGWDAEYMGYTNVDNPFGDEHLLDTFAWKKKLDSEGMTDVEMSELTKLQKRKMMENKLELEKVKKRRLEREKEREERQQEREMMQREKESEYYREWEKQEDTFHLQQAKLRSKIRIGDGRAKPIDLLAQYISTEDDEDVTIEMHEPYTYLHGLRIEDLEDLLADIRVYTELDSQGNLEFWQDMTTITEEELSKLRRMDPGGVGAARRSGVNEAVLEDVASVFKGKSLSQLQLLEGQIRSKLEGGQGVDVGYWESLLQQLRTHMARSRLRERHKEQLKIRLSALKHMQGIQETRQGPAPRREEPAPRREESESWREEPAPRREESESRREEPAPRREESESRREEPEPREEELEPKRVGLAEEELLPSTSPVHPDPDDEDYLCGGYSPVLLQVTDLEPDTLITDPQEDHKRLEFARQNVVVSGQAKRDADEDLMRRAREGMRDDEAQFSVEAHLEPQAFVWSDKYRPRKPRFFNRVHTGFEWNKYNQTHYDMDNPPPKIVQGYKFNIFFPDLIDKSKAPSYTITPIEDSPDFAVLRFVAGPPYEDIAFKIVNREWEYSYKRGYRCQFQNNIFQLWFHFKRFRYRR